MPSRGLHGLWLRGVTAAAACLLALASTGAMVTAAVVGHTGSGPVAVLTSDGNGDGNGHANGDGNGNGNGNGDSHGHGQGNGNGDGTGIGNSAGADLAAILAQLKAEAEKPKAPKPATKPAPKPVDGPKHVVHSNPTSHSSAPAAPAGPQTAAAAPKVVVDTSDPAPFSAQAVSASEAARVLPVESLGPLSGISFGSGLFIWPLLLAVDVFALAVIARMALRRRLVSAED